MKGHVVIKTVARLLVPFMQLFSFYVIAHGDMSPGGGFQGGVILGASIILYVIVFGRGDARKKFSEKTIDILTSTGVLIYAGVGLFTLIFGGAYLEYGVIPLGDRHLANHLGIYAIEIGVAVTVCAVMATIFFEVIGNDD